MRVRSARLISTTPAPALSPRPTLRTVTLNPARQKPYWLSRRETLSRIVDYTDRSTCILFGDGAAAAVYQATEDETVGILSTFTAADGSGAEYLHMEALPVEDPLSGDRTVDPKARFLKMQGAPVVRFTARAVPLAIDTALKRAGVTAEEIDWVVPHQANLRILDVIARRYHLPKEKIYVNMDRFGNTSSASVPICLTEMREERPAEGRVRPLSAAASAEDYLWRFCAEIVITVQYSIEMYNTGYLVQ